MFLSVYTFNLGVISTLLIAISVEKGLNKLTVFFCEPGEVLREVKVVTIEVLNVGISNLESLIVLIVESPTLLILRLLIFEVVPVV